MFIKRNLNWAEYQSIVCSSWEMISEFMNLGPEQVNREEYAPPFPHTGQHTLSPLSYKGGSTYCVCTCLSESKGKPQLTAGIPHTAACTRALTRQIALPLLFTANVKM